MSVETNAFVRLQRSGKMARPFGWAAGWVVFASVFLNQVAARSTIEWVEAVPDMKWVVDARVMHVDAFDAWSGPLGWGVFLLLVAWMGLWWFENGRRREARVSVEEDAVVITYEGRLRRKRRIPFASIVSVRVEDPPKPNTLWLRLEGGAEVTVDSVNAPEVAEAIQAKLSNPPTVHTQRTANLVPGGGVFRFMWAWAFLPLMGRVEDAGQALAAGNYMPAAMMAVVAVMWTVLGLMASSSANVTVGEDGVRVHRAWHSRFVPFSRVEGVAKRLGVLQLVLKGGGRVWLGTTNQAELESRVGAALERYREASTSISEENADALRRGDRSVDAWRAGVDKALSAQEYRAEPLRIAELEELVDTPGAHPEQRIAAALALPKDDASKRRIARAASQCADPDLRAALEAAAVDEVLESELARATRRFAVT